MNREITMGSLFDGIAGFPLASVRNGIIPIFASEIEPFPMAVSRQFFPDMKHLGNIQKLDGKSIPPVDIITGGSPCQDLSMAGLRKGLSGERSGLFGEQIRIIKEMRENDIKSGCKGKEIRPRFVLWENVPGASSSSKGEDFRCVLEEICKIKDETITIPKPAKNKWLSAGCIMGAGFSLAWKVLDAQYWGVPQRRKRIFLVADFGGGCAPEILFDPKSLSGNTQESKSQRETITERLRNGASVSGNEKLRVLPFNTSFILSPQSHSNPKFGDACHTLGARSHASTVVIENCVNLENRKTFNSNTYSIWKNSDIASTLKSCGGFNGGGSENLAVTERTVRKLTPLECERLQGFPDNWTLLDRKDTFSDDEFEFWKKIYASKRKIKKEPTKEQVLNWYNKLCSDSARYKALGNSVAVPCVEFIMRKIKEVGYGDGGYL